MRTPHHTTSWALRLAAPGEESLAHCAYHHIEHFSERCVVVECAAKALEEEEKTTDEFVGISASFEAQPAEPNTDAATSGLRLLLANHLSALNIEFYPSDFTFQR